MADLLAHFKASLADRYRIEREIGAGGMATVFLARDVRHERHVAIKLLNPELGAVLGVERFLSEIRVTANLQHPNLLPLFDSGEADGQLFYVMPYVEGESLGAKLKREKQLPIEEAIHIATAVASALDYAHRHGVIHRDLKPENILLHEGQPMVADFGIALAVSKAGGQRITQTGLSLGTPQYMSPEQATGDRDIDGRTDIYSLGAVVYEMLTGDPPHTGSTSQAIIAKVITDRPRGVRLARDTVAPHVEAAVDKALAKLPADRFATAHQFADALLGKAVILPSGVALPGSLTSPGLQAPPRHWKRMVVQVAPWIVAIAGLGFGASGLMRRDEQPRPVGKFLLDFPDSARYVAHPASCTSLAISPDGSRIAYVGGSDRLFVRRLDEVVPQAITATDGPRCPFFSPDGEWVAFFRRGLHKVPVGGGTSVDVANVATSAYSGGSWGDDGNLVVAVGEPLLLHRVSALGGPLEPIASLDTARGELGQRWPHVLPGSRQVVFTSWRGTQGSQIAVLDLRTRQVSLLGQTGVSAVYTENGFLLVVQANGSLHAFPFDAASARITGAGVPVMNGISTHAVSGAAELKVSRNGTLAYSDRASTGDQLVIADRRGTVTPLPTPATGLSSFGTPRVSPDGNRIVMTAGGDVTNSLPQIWVYSIPTRTLSRLTFNGQSIRPKWMPDGRRVSYSASRDNVGIEKNGLYAMLADGSAPEVLLLGGLLVDPLDAAWAPDGNVVLRHFDERTRRDIAMVSLSGDRKLRPLVNSPFEETSPAVSRDGRWLAYISNESGAYQVYVRSYPSMAGRWQVSTDGGIEPVWGPSGRELLYWNDNKLIAAEYLPNGSSFTVVKQTTLFEMNRTGNIFHTAWDVFPKGDRFILARPLGGDARTFVVVNWFEELERRARPAGR